MVAYKAFKVDKVFKELRVDKGQLQQVLQAWLDGKAHKALLVFKDFKDVRGFKDHREDKVLLQQALQV